MTLPDEGNGLPAYVPPTEAQRTRERSAAIWALYTETLALSRIVSQYNPGLRRGLPSPSVLHYVNEARSIMLSPDEDA